MTTTTTTKGKRPKVTTEKVTPVAPVQEKVPTLHERIVVNMAGAALRLSTYLLLAVADAFRTGMITWDENGSGGKGRASGGKDLLAALATAAQTTGVTLPDGLKGQVSKVARVVGTNVHGARDLTGDMSDDARHDACMAWVARHGSPTQQGEKADGETGGDTWEKLLASIATRANALTGDETGVEETIARLFRGMKDAQRERCIVRLSTIDGRVRTMA